MNTILESGLYFVRITNDHYHSTLKTIGSPRDQGQKPEPKAMFNSDMEVYVNNIRRNNPERAKVIEDNINIMRKWAKEGI